MIGMMVATSHIADKIFEEKGVSEDDLNDAVIKHKIIEDPLVK